MFALLLSFCLFSFCFCSFSDIFSTDFWLTSHQFSHEVASLLDKLKSTVLPSRAPGTSLNYTTAFTDGGLLPQKSWVSLPRFL